MSKDQGGVGIQVNYDARAGSILNIIIDLMRHDTRIVFDTRYPVFDTRYLHRKFSLYNLKLLIIL